MDKLDRAQNAQFGGLKTPGSASALHRHTWKYSKFGSRKMRFYIILVKLVSTRTMSLSCHKLYYLPLSQYLPKESDGVVQKFAEELEHFENLIHLIPK